MDDIFVGRLMSTNLRTAAPETLVEDAAQVMLENDVGSVLVVDDTGCLEGILTTTDFVQIVAERKPKDQTPVSRYMSTDVVTASPGDHVQAVAAEMVDRGIHHLPVTTDDGEVVGMISTTDLTSYVSELRSPISA